MVCNAALADPLTKAHELARLVSDLSPASKPVISGNVRDGLYASIRDHSTMKVVHAGYNLTLNVRPNKLNVQWERVEPLTPTNLAAFAGIYTDQEAETRLDVKVEGKELVGHNNPTPRFH